MQSTGELQTEVSEKIIGGIAQGVKLGDGIEETSLRHVSAPISFFQPSRSFLLLGLL